MNVGELKAAIADLPDDMVVIQSADPEGNWFMQTDEIAVSKATPDPDPYGGREWQVHHPDDIGPGGDHYQDLLFDYAIEREDGKLYGEPDDIEEFHKAWQKFQDNLTEVLVIWP